MDSEGYAARRDDETLRRWNNVRKMMNGETLSGGFVAPAEVRYRPDPYPCRNKMATFALRAEPHSDHIGGSYVETHPSVALAPNSRLPERHRYWIRIVFLCFWIFFYI